MGKAKELVIENKHGELIHLSFSELKDWINKKLDVIKELKQQNEKLLANCGMLIAKNDKLLKEKKKMIKGMKVIEENE